MENRRTFSNSVGNLLARPLGVANIQKVGKRESGEPDWIHRSFICCLNAFTFLSSGGKLKCQIALSFLRKVFNLNYLKIETLLAIAATATIATAIIVIVSIKQSPFFNQLIILFNV